MADMEGFKVIRIREEAIIEATKRAMTVREDEEIGAQTYLYRFKCVSCGLEFMVFSWYPAWPERHVPICPECGTRSGDPHKIGPSGLIGPVLLDATPNEKPLCLLGYEIICRAAEVQEEDGKGGDP